MYNLRYHIASLVAVFLSLAVGLLLGTVVVERGVLDRQKTTLVEGLTRDFEEMRTTNTGMRAQLDRQTAFADQTAGQLTSGALAGRIVLLVSDPTRGETLSGTADTIRRAGGVPVIATFRDKGFGLADKELASKVAPLVGVAADDEMLPKKTAEALAREFLVPPGSRPVAQALEAAGELTMEGQTATMTVSGMVVTASYGGQADTGQVAMLSAFQALGRPAIGVESTKKATGVAVAASAAGCSAVDDIDEAIGRVSLVWVLAGRTSGHFGVGKDVDAPFPTPLFPGS